MSKLTKDEIHEIAELVLKALRPVVDGFLQREANNVESMTKWHVRETIRTEALLPAVREAVKKMVRDSVEVEVRVKNGN